ncbi:MAG TPA: hypothetical protein VJT50_06915 [Pyrinomonadaceae bacterium]|nr:hypothetical protein [Pyrinomonadaceae bacterium]
MISADAYFVLSAITAIKALVAVGLATPHPDDWVHSDNGQVTVTKPDKTYLFYVIAKGNDNELNIRANYLTATLVGLRNGSVLLTIALALAVFTHSEPKNNNATRISRVPLTEIPGEANAIKVERTANPNILNANAPFKPGLVRNSRSKYRNSQRNPSRN